MDSDLPFEVLCEILSHLNVKHRLSTSLVSRRWFDACNTKLKDVCLSINSPDRMTSTLKRPYCNVRFDSVTIDQQCVEFLNNCLCPQLLYLEFTCCDVKCGPCVINCQKLLTLEADCPESLMSLTPPLKCLQILNLYDAKDISDETMAIIDVIAPNLKVFKVPNRMVFDRRVIKRFYPGSSTTLSPHILSAPAVENLIAKRTKTLTSLRFSRETSHDAALRVAATPGLTLTEVDMTKCNNCISAYRKFFELQPHVTVLKLDGVYKLGYTEVETISCLLPSLRVFSACNCGSKDAALNLDMVLAVLFRLQHLRRVSLNCFRFPGGPLNMHYPLQLFKSVELVSLDLGNEILDVDQVEELLTRAPNLRDLRTLRMERIFQDELP